MQLISTLMVGNSSNKFIHKKLLVPFGWIAKPEAEKKKQYKTGNTDQVDGLIFAIILVFEFPPRES